jgi:hypothetical protein
MSEYVRFDVNAAHRALSDEPSTQGAEASEFSEKFARISTPLAQRSLVRKNGYSRADTGENGNQEPQVSTFSDFSTPQVPHSEISREGMTPFLPCPNCGALTHVQVWHNRDGWQLLEKPVSPVFGVLHACIV